MKRNIMGIVCCCNTKIIDGVLLMVKKLSDLDIKIYKYLIKNAKKGIPQNELWKKLKLTSRDASRSLKKLEQLGYVRRTPIVHNGRKTFLVKPVPKPLPVEKKEEIRRYTIDFSKYLDIPCMYCPYIDSQCYEGGLYDPATCDYLTEWIMENIRRRKSRGRVQS
jgi:predicted transcriptional regulator